MKDRQADEMATRYALNHSRTILNVRMQDAL